MLGILRRVFDFGDWTRHHPQDQVPGDMLDASFDAQNQRISELEALVSQILRSDGSLQNETVSFDSFTAEVRKFLVSEVEDAVKTATKRVLDLYKETKTASEVAENAQQSAISAASVAMSTKNHLSSVKIDVFEAINVLEGQISATKALLRDAAGVRTDWDDASSEAQAWANASAMWAEWMPSTLPAESMALTGVTGDHWSSRWWANQAANAFGMLTSLYLGAHSEPPATNANGGEIQIGSIYYDIEDQQPYVWTGSGWEPFYAGVSAAATMSLWYGAAAGQTSFPLGTADLNGQAYALDPVDTEDLAVHVNGTKLMPGNDFTVDPASSTVTFLRPLRAGDIVSFDVLVPPEKLGPGAVFSWALQPLAGIDGIATDFDLVTRDGAGPVVNAHKADELIVSLDGVLQEPVVSYTALGDTIHFVTAPAADSHVFITWLQSDGGSGIVALTAVDWADITGKPATFPYATPIPQADVATLPADLAAKLDLLGGTMTGKLTTKAALAAGAGFNVPMAAANPTSFVDGDLWFNTSGALTFRMSGSTRQVGVTNNTNSWTNQQTFTVKPLFPVPTSGAGSINLAPGTAPTSPANGDLWVTTAGLFARINGVTVGPFT